MEVFLSVLAVCCGLAGLAGCILPGIPGPPLAYAGLLLVQWAFQPFSPTLLVVTGIVTAIILIVDYYIPIWTARRFGATRQGIWGSVIGMIAGILFTPLGMIAGLILGAIIGDMIAGRSLPQAARSASGTFFGTLITIGLKTTWTIILLYYIVSRIVMNYM